MTYSSSLRQQLQHKCLIYSAKLNHMKSNQDEHVFPWNQKKNVLQAQHIINVLYYCKETLWQNVSLSLLVGGLLQARFTSGLLSQLSDSPRPPPSRGSPAAVETPRQLHWAGPGPSSFVLPPRAPEPSIRTVGVRRLGGPVPLKESVTQGKVGTDLVSSDVWMGLRCFSGQFTLTLNMTQNEKETEIIHFVLLLFCRGVCWWTLDCLWVVPFGSGGVPAGHWHTVASGWPRRWANSSSNKSWWPKLTSASHQNLPGANRKIQTWP